MEYNPLYCGPEDELPEDGEEESGFDVNEEEDEDDE